MEKELSDILTLDLIKKSKSYLIKVILILGTVILFLSSCIITYIYRGYKKSQKEFISTIIKSDSIQSENQIKTMRAVNNLSLEVTDFKVENQYDHQKINGVLKIIENSQSSSNRLIIRTFLQSMDELKKENNKPKPLSQIMPFKTTPDSSNNSIVSTTPVKKINYRALLLP